MAHKKRESTITALSLVLDQRGQLVLEVERRRCPIGSLREEFNTLPEWDHAQDTLEAARWIDDLLQDTYNKIMKRYNEHEGIRLQERDVRPEGEARRHNDNPEREGGGRLSQTSLCFDEPPSASPDADFHSKRRSRADGH